MAYFTPAQVEAERKRRKVEAEREKRGRGRQSKVEKISIMNKLLNETME